MNELKISDKAKEARNEYQRQWRQKNRDKLKKYNAAYWEKKAKQDETPLDRAIENYATDNRNNVTDKFSNELSVTHCFNCGEAFTPKRSDAKFCSSNCRVQYNRKNK